jgi:lipopolysaccharide/colanic/teichoic acid biosynthesis glycosyltransferase
MGLQKTIKERPSLKSKTAKKTSKKPAVKPVSDSPLNIRELIIEEVGSEAMTFIDEYVNCDDGSTFLASTTTRFNIDKIPSKKFSNIVNLKRINDIRRINKFFESVNLKIPTGGVYINKVETYLTRKTRILRKSFFPLNWMHYTLDVIVHRVFPKVPVTKKIYFWITKGRNRVLSKAETLGRLYSCGFEVIGEKYIGDFLYFAVRKIKDPFYPANPTYGPLIRLRRHGKNGELFTVYKMRTMHAYSEYLQEYIYRNHNLEEGGKFKNDFRITSEGKFFRKFWLDEVPMFINLIKGDMKIFGVRPLSSHYFNLYTDELKEKRIKYKPGLIPPFYADMPKTLDEIMESELRYLDEYEKHPRRTDMKYFFKAWSNIIFRHARSK